MNRFFKRQRSSEEGQILVIVGVGLLAMIAMVGLVVDGGYAWGQQRQTQNGADAMANAGATVIAQNLKGAPKTGGDVDGSRVEAAYRVVEGDGAVDLDAREHFANERRAVGGDGVVRLEDEAAEAALLRQLRQVDVIEAPR